MIPESDEDIDFDPPDDGFILIMFITVVLVITMLWRLLYLVLECIWPRPRTLPTAALDMKTVQKNKVEQRERKLFRDCPRTDSVHPYLDLESVQEEDKNEEEGRADNQQPSGEFQQYLVVQEMSEGRKTFDMIIGMPH
ncbi:hypothetical protein J6590_011897 [Homalodisca vitripennis]|nr:hypothetical protein J6590_011897 [Homalodisca vitripennis]